MNRLGRVLVLERVDEVVFEVILAQAVVLGVVAEEGGEALGLEHEAGVVGVSRDSAEGVFGPR